MDDSRDIATVLRQYIEREPDMECVGTLHSADDLVSQISERRPDVVLLDLTMPGKNPLAVLREWRAAAAGKRRGVRVIVFSGRDDEAVIDIAADAGACGYLSKSAAVPQILGALREMARKTGKPVPFGVWR